MLKERQIAKWSRRVFDLRLKLALSQEEFAVLLGVSRVSITWWETGKHVPIRLHRGKIEQLGQETGGNDA